MTTRIRERLRPVVGAVPGDTNTCAWCGQPATKHCEACGCGVCAAHLHSRRVGVDVVIVCPKHAEG